MAGMGMAFQKRPVDDQQNQDQADTQAPAGQQQDAPAEEQAEPTQQGEQEPDQGSDGQDAGADQPGGDQAAPPSDAKGGDAEGGGHAPASPEEQAMYERIMSNALKIIYPEGESEGQVSPQVLASLKANPDKPLLGVATTAVSIVSGLRDSAQKAGIVDQWNTKAQQSGGDTLDFDEILYHVGQAVVEDLCEIDSAAKIHDFNDKETETAFYMALDMYRTHATQSGALNADALKAQWGQLVEADKAGQLGKLLPGIQDRMKGGDGSDDNSGQQPQQQGAA